MNQSQKDRQALADHRWYEAHQEQAKAKSRERWQGLSMDEKQRHRFRRYGATPDWFRDQLVGQAGRCAICGDVMDPGRGTHIDHDHASNKPRGLLCRACNLMLGHARDSGEILIKAASYLARST